MLLGLAFGAWFDAHALKSTILPLTFVMVYPMMVNLNIRKIFTRGDTRVQVVTQAINFLLIPFLGFGLGKVFFPGQPLVQLGLLLTALLPTSGMTISWTGFAKGNMIAAVKMTVIGLILGSVLTPFYLQLLLGAQVAIPLLKVFQQIAGVVFLPMLAGYATQQLLVKKYGQARYQKDIKPVFPPISTIGVLSIVFVAMALKSQAILAHPALLLKYALPLVLLYGANFGLSTLAGKWFFKRAEGIALVYGSAMRNLSIALAIAMTVFGEQGSEIALIIAVAYIIQVQAGAWYVKFTDRIFGQAPPDVAADLMRRGVFLLNQEKTIAEAITLIEEEHIHSLVVTNREEAPVGILNTRNLFDHLVNTSNDITRSIAEVALKPMLVFDEGDSLEMISQAMRDNQVYKVLIRDRNHLPVGVITETDFFKKVLN